MPRFALSVLLLLSCLSASLVLIRAGGTFGPDETPLARYGFAKCEGMPCYQGIVPGVTTWTTAVTQYPDRRTTYLIGVRVGTGLLTVRRMPGADTVSGFGYTMPTNHTTNLRLGDFIRLYGPPCLVQPSDMTSTQALITFPFGWAVAVPRDQRLRPDSRLLTFAVNASPDTADRVWDTGMCPHQRLAGVTSRWHGFARASSYQLVGEKQP